MKNKQQISYQRNDLPSILNNEQGERKIHDYLKQYPDIVVSLFNHAWNYYICIPEFELGSDFRADFLILSNDSMSWHAIIVELKAINVSLYREDGSPSKALNEAQQQIRQRKDFVRRNEYYLRQNFAKILRRNDAPPRYSSFAENGGDDIENMHTFVHYEYRIVLGRSSKLSPQEQKYRMLANNDGTYNYLEILTYDRFLQLWRNG